MFVRNFIEENGLKQCDAVELTDQFGLKHYALLLDQPGCTEPRFIGNLNNGVQVLSGKQIEKYVQSCEITDIERFPGNDVQRRRAILRAIKRIGEKAYNMVLHNCEHFKNWVLYGKSTSKQVVAMTTTAALVGFGATVIGMHSGSKGLEKTGKIILIILLAVFIVAIFLLAMNPPKETE